MRMSAISDAEQRQRGKTCRRGVSQRPKSPKSTIGSEKPPIVQVPQSPKLTSLTLPANLRAGLRVEPSADHDDVAADIGLGPRSRLPPTTTRPSRTRPSTRSDPPMTTTASLTLLRPTGTWMLRPMATRAAGRAIDLRLISGRGAWDGLGSDGF